MTERGTTPYDHEAERFIQQLGRDNAYARIRGMDDRETIQEWVAWINRQDRNYQWALKALKHQAKEIA